jgi:hypothetical protein
VRDDITKVIPNSEWIGVGFRLPVDLTLSEEIKWAGNQEAVTFLGYRPIRS